MSQPKRPESVIYATTIGISAHSLLKGQLRWLKDQGWSVTLVSTPDDAAVRTAEREGVPLEGIPMKRNVAPLNDFIALRRWISLLRRLRPYAVHVGTPKAGLLGILAAWVTRVPKRIYIVRGLRLEGASGPLKAVLWAMERLTTAAATDIIVVSESLAQELFSRNLANPRKTWLLGSGSSNGVDWAGISQRASEVDPGRVRSSLGLKSSDFVVGFVGRVTPDKGITTLIRAFQSTDLHPSAKLLVIGPVEDPELASNVATLGGRVRTVPWTDDVWGHLPALDVLCLPSLREGFPTVVLEAAAAGVPAITTRATGAVDSVVDGETGLLIDINDDRALVAHVNHLRSDPALRARMGKAAQDRARSHFQQERVWRGVVEVLASAPDAKAATRMDRLPIEGETL